MLPEALLALSLLMSEPTLSPCPDSPNCVSSLAADPDRRMPPLVYDLSEERVLERIVEVVEASPRACVVETKGLYLHAEFTSLVFRFVDDVEFLLDPEARRIHFRSASRTGYSDLGVNRRRMEKLCRKLAETEGIRTE